MPFTTDQEQLKTLIDEAIERPEIAEKVGSQGLTYEILADEIIPKAEDIWNKSAAEIKRFHEFEKETTALSQQITEKLLEERGIKKPINPYTDKQGIEIRKRYSSYVRLTDWITIGFSAAYLTSFVLLRVYESEWGLPGWTTSLSGVLTIFSGASVIPILLIISRSLRKHSDKSQTYRHNYVQEFHEYSSAVNEVRVGNKEIEALRTSFSEALGNLRNTIIEKEILPIIRPVVNNWLDPVYSTAIKIIEAPGLAEVFNSAYEVPTVSKDKLEFMLHSMPGGSIGIAGPRGVGKTTLISAYCRTVLKPIQGRPVLSIMTSAPVEYQFRDFILHLFSMVCLRTLQAQKVNYDPSINRDAGIPDQSTRRRTLGQVLVILDLLSRFLMVAFYAGITLIIFSVIAAGVLFYNQTSNTGNTPANKRDLTGNSDQAGTIYANSTGTQPTQTGAIDKDEQRSEGYYHGSY